MSTGKYDKHITQKMLLLHFNIAVNSILKINLNT